VAIIGCYLPLNEHAVPHPAKVATKSAAPIAIQIGEFGMALKITAYSASRRHQPRIATIEPTEMSIPCVAMTSVSQRPVGMIGAKFLII